MRVHFGRCESKGAETVVTRVSAARISSQSVNEESGKESSKETDALAEDFVAIRSALIEADDNRVTVRQTTDNAPTDTDPLEDEAPWEYTS